MSQRKGPITTPIKPSSIQFNVKMKCIYYRNKRANDNFSRCCSVPGLYLKILPWLNLRPCLSVPTHEKYCLTRSLVSPAAGSSFFQSYTS